MSNNQENQRQTKNFYFQEIEKIIEFPICGNQGKYFKYRVNIKNKDTANKSGNPALLSEFLAIPEVENNYPHTIGYYKESIGEGAEFKPEYLELRKICYVEEFWLFLNACNV